MSIALHLYSYSTSGFQRQDSSTAELINHAKHHDEDFTLTLS